MTVMNLDKLAEQRRFDPRAPLPIGDGELCDRYGRLYTGAVNDVLREFALMHQALPFDIVPLREGMKAAGIAFTIMSAKDPTVELDEEMSSRARMLSEIPADAICVWDTNRDDLAAHWGGMMTAATKRRGVRGAVVDGGVRDVHQILEQDFPVFHRYRTSNGALGRVKIVAHQVPIEIGGVIICPGDVVLADLDGVIAIPRRLAHDVLLRAEAIVRHEEDIKGWIEAGDSATAVVKKGGYF